MIPLVGASLMWVVPGVLWLAGIGADGSGATEVMFLLLALTALGAAAWAQRRGASWWALLWGMAGAAATVVLFFVIVLVALSVAPGDTVCPDDRVYC